QNADGGICGMWERFLPTIEQTLTWFLFTQFLICTTVSGRFIQRKRRTFHRQSLCKMVSRKVRWSLQAASCRVVRCATQSCHLTCMSPMVQRSKVRCFCQGFELGKVR